MLGYMHDRYIGIFYASFELIKCLHDLFPNCTLSRFKHKAKNCYYKSFVVHKCCLNVQVGSIDEDYVF